MDAVEQFLPVGLDFSRIGKISRHGRPFETSGFALSSPDRARYHATGPGIT
jgi:hypothetical protein